jgi:hypothetical protein
MVGQILLLKPAQSFARQWRLVGELCPSRVLDRKICRWISKHLKAHMRHSSIPSEQRKYRYDIHAGTVTTHCNPGRV